MKKFLKRMVVCVLAVACLVTSMPVSAWAADVKEGVCSYDEAYCSIIDLTYNEKYNILDKIDVWYSKDPVSIREWSSSDETIATIKNNKLVAKNKSGICEIQIIDGAFPYQEHNFTINVRRPDVNVKKPEITLDVGESTTIKLTNGGKIKDAYLEFEGRGTVSDIKLEKSYTLPETVAVYSSDEKQYEGGIVSVTKNGKVTAKREGEVCVCVVDKDGNNYYCLVTVVCKHDYKFGKV